jgi:predicted transcriptional regulator
MPSSDSILPNVNSITVTDPEIHDSEQSNQKSKIDKNEENQDSTVEQFPVTPEQIGEPVSEMEVPEPEKPVLEHVASDSLAVPTEPVQNPVQEPVAAQEPPAPPIVETPEPKPIIEPSVAPEATPVMAPMQTTTSPSPEVPSATNESIEHKEEIQHTTPAVVGEAEPTPAVAPTTQELPTPEHAQHEQKYTDGIPERVLALTKEELDAARRLWAREHIGEAQKASRDSRKKRMNEAMNEIEKIVKKTPDSRIHSIANEIGLSEKLTSSYVEKLVAAGRIKGRGNTGNRRYY